MLDRLIVVTTTCVTYPINFWTLPMTTIHMGFYNIYQPFSFGWDFDGKCIGKLYQSLGYFGISNLMDDNNQKPSKQHLQRKRSQNPPGWPQSYHRHWPRVPGSTPREPDFFCGTPTLQNCRPILVRDEESLPEKHVLKLSCSWCPWTTMF